jgi:hypothetical protein
MARPIGSLSKYWLWLVIFTGISAAIPFVPSKSGADKIPISSYYETVLIDYSQQHHSFRLNIEEECILLHAIASTLLAVACHLLMQIHAKRTKKNFQPEPRHFSMRGLLICMASMSIICALLASFDVGWVLYAASLIFAGGRIVDFYLTAYFTTSREDSESLEG